MCKKGQGATEYLLMLAAVLVIVAIAVYYVTSTGPSAIIIGTAIKNGDAVEFTPSSTMTPAYITSSDWNYAIYRGATKIFPADPNVWQAGTGTLQRGIPESMTATNNQIGDVLKIKYQGSSVFDAGTVS